MTGDNRIPSRESATRPEMHRPTQYLRADQPSLGRNYMAFVLTLTVPVSYVLAGASDEGPRDERTVR